MTYINQIPSSILKYLDKANTSRCIDTSRYIDRRSEKVREREREREREKERRRRDGEMKREREEEFIKTIKQTRASSR